MKGVTKSLTQNLPCVAFINKMQMLKPLTINGSEAGFTHLCLKIDYFLAVLFMTCLVKYNKYIVERYSCIAMKCTFQVNNNR